MNICCWKLHLQQAAGISCSQLPDQESFQDHPRYPAFQDHRVPISKRAYTETSSNSSFHLAAHAMRAFSTMSLSKYAEGMIVNSGGGSYCHPADCHSMQNGAHLAIKPTGWYWEQRQIDELVQGICHSMQHGAHLASKPAGWSREQEQVDEQVQGFSLVGRVLQVSAGHH